MPIELIDYRDGEQILEAAIARPSTNDVAPAVLVVHQWSGRGEGEDRAIERLAAAGYVGIAIDVYGKGVKGELTGDNTHLMMPWAKDRSALLNRLMAGLDFARALDGVDASAVAAIGYCFGGLCVLDLARSSAAGLAGVVSLHGTLDGHSLPIAGPITAKVLVEHGWLDPLSPPDKLLAFAEEMKARAADWQLHVHGTAMHAFTEPGVQNPEYGMAYDAGADRRSWSATMSFLDEMFSHRWSAAG